MRDTAKAQGLGAEPYEDAPEGVENRENPDWFGTARLKNLASMRHASMKAETPRTMSSLRQVHHFHISPEARHINAAGGCGVARNRFNDPQHFHTQKTRESDAATLDPLFCPESDQSCWKT